LRKYELLCMLKAGFDIENTDQIIANLEKALNNLGGTILETNKIGRKRLAYDIKGNRDSFCVNFNIEIEPTKLNELKKYLKLNDNVLRDFITTLKAAPKADPKAAPVS